MFALSYIILSLGIHVSAVKYGDEKYGDISGGKFWAFHTAGVSIVDPETCEIETTITQDPDNNGLPEKWSDGVFMKDGDKGYAIINSGVMNPQTKMSEVIIFSTNDNKVVSRVPVGPRVVHSYGVTTHNEYWTHSDGDGNFYVINLEDISNHTGNKVKVFEEKFNHGKLLWDEDDHLGEKGIGYSTSTGETIIFVVDILREKQLSKFDYSNYILKDTCSGTHAIAYSGINQHLYIECSGGGGTLELDVSKASEPKFVKQWLDVTGSIYEVPDGSYVVASDKRNNKLHVFQPNETGSVSTVSHTVKIPGHPSTPTFFPARKSSGEADYIACMPLTENTNKNNMDSSGNIKCDIYSCNGAQTQEDVTNGICAYSPAQEKILLSANLENITEVVAGDFPYFEACKRCEDKNNYGTGSDAEGASEGAEDTCICTPKCGSCADPLYDASDSGVMCVDLFDVINNNVTEGSLIKGAGSVKQGSPYSYSAQCSYGRTYRNHKRGGIYDASVANYPKDSIQIVNMEKQEFKCQVSLDGVPNRIIYVPYSAEKSKSSSKLVIMSITIGIIFFVIVIVMMFVRCKRNGQDKNYDKNMNVKSAPQSGTELESKDTVENNGSVV